MTPVSSRKVSIKEGQTCAFQRSTEKLFSNDLCVLPWMARGAKAMPLAEKIHSRPSIKITNIYTLLLKEMQNLGVIPNVL